MTTKRWFPSGATPRGVPASRRALPRRPVVLLLLALVALTETGCQSMCSPCGPVATGWRGFRDTVSRPFRRMRSAPASGACCGSEVGTEVAPLPYGSPAIVTPAPGSSSTVPPGASESLPSALEPIPQASPGPPPASSESTPSQGAKSPNGKASYEAYRPRFGDDTTRPESLARSANPSPAPTNRSAQGSRPSSGAEANPLDNLPPLDLPKDVARGGGPSSPAEPEKKPAAGPDPVADGSLGAPAAPASEVLAAPGIRRFAGVESKLAGGSLPTAAGLDWLVEKGYKTVLDLREGPEMSASFIADVSGRGLRYVALPLNAKSVDAVHVSRFESEIALADSRPLYFCDNDGNRPGVMWYVHRVAVDKVDSEVARRDAEELGLTDPAYWAAAKAYLDARKPQPVTPPAATPPKPAAGAGNAPAPPPAPAAVPSPAAATPAPTPAAAKPAPAAPAPAATPATPPAPGAGKPSAGNDAGAPRDPVAAAESAGPSVQDPNAWRPLAAMLVTGFGVPLAYVSRAAIPTTLRALSRASLPAPKTSPRSLPGGSGG